MHATSERVKGGLELLYGERVMRQHRDLGHRAAAAPRQALGSMCLSLRFLPAPVEQDLGQLVTMLSPISPISGQEGGRAHIISTFLSVAAFYFFQSVAFNSSL